MIRNIINLIKREAENIDGVKTFRYEGRDLTNTQNNNSVIQINIESDIYIDYLVTKEMCKMVINLTILDNIDQTDEKNCGKDVWELEDDSICIGEIPEGTEIVESMNIDTSEDKKTLLDVQNKCFKIAVVLMKFIEMNGGDLISIADYSIMTLDRYTDDELAGVRLTLSLYCPSPVSYCDLSNYYNKFNRYDQKCDRPICVDTPQINVDDLNISPIKL